MYIFLTLAAFDLLDDDGLELIALLICCFMRHYTTILSPNCFSSLQIVLGRYRLLHVVVSRCRLG